MTAIPDAARTNSERIIEELRQQLDQRTVERDAALAQQQATAEILEIINRSPGNPAPVFDAIIERAMRLCDAPFGGLLVPDGDLVRYVAMGNAPKPFAEFLTRERIRLDTMLGPEVLKGTVLHLADLSQHEAYRRRIPVTVSAVENGGIRSLLSVPLMKDGKLVGAFTLYRQEVRPFSAREIATAKSFAAQAAIAMENGRLLSELRKRTDDLQQSLEYQTATSDVLKVISRSTFDLQPVLDTLIRTAGRLCIADGGALSLREGDTFHYLASIDDDEFSRAMKRRTFVPGRDTVAGRVMLEDKVVHITDAAEDSGLNFPRVASRPEMHTGLGVPLLRDSVVVGAFTLTRNRVEPFTERQIELIRTFADQAVIAIENARLLTELRESLEQQQAIAEVLQVINASPGNLTPVFDAILDKAHSLCGANIGWLLTFDGEFARVGASRGLVDLDPSVASAPFLPGPAMRRLIEGESFFQIPNISDAKNLPGTPLIWRASCALLGEGNYLVVPLRKDGTVHGFINAFRSPIRLFSDKEIALLENFAAQAVIAMDNARLLEEINRRQAELRVTFENMGDAVIMFDGQHQLVAWNRNFQEVLDIPDDWLASPRSYSEFAEYLTSRGEFGGAPPPDIGAPDRDGAVRAIRYERTRPDGRVLEVRRNPIPGGGGFVFIYSDITERKRAEESILAAREAAERALADLKLAQANLIQAEKMASLGALTAGIAHEIKNPLNFVNNFANLSNELLGELKDAAAPALATLDAGRRAEIDETMAMLTGNLDKIQEHGRRADGIVKSMLAHSRGGTGERRAADLNALVEESLNLAYHGARAQDQNFNITLERDYDKSIAPIELVPQDITRVFLNLCGNGFYAANKRRRDGGAADFRPVLKVATKELGDAVEVRIRDNGTGIPAEIRDKLFQPFFTTKPTGEGTGLGLSISYDIVTQQHGGAIAVDSRPGDFTEFTIRLPRKR